MSRTSYELADGIARITMDDGKVNALSSSMLAELANRFQQAEADEAVVVLTGRERTFSGGFDLRTEAEGWPEMLIAGASMAERIMGHPRPVVAACNGNAIAMAAFVLLSADYRVGAAGDFRIGLNEVAIGLTLPHFAIAIAEHRLTRPYFDRCTVTGVLLGPEEARDAGFLDEVVAPESLEERAMAAARKLAGVDAKAHAATKLRIRGEAMERIRDGIERIKGDGREW